MLIKHAHYCAFTKDNIIATFQTAGLSPLQGVVAAHPDNATGPHDAIKTASGGSDTTLKDKVTIARFIVDGVALEVK